MEFGKWDMMQMDCLVNIFSRLCLDDLTTSIPLVCKSWNEASVDPLCRQILDFSHLDSPRFSSSGFLKLSLARASGATVDLRFSSLFSASKQDLFLISNECPKLKKLILPRIEKEDEEQFLKAISKWKELEVLEMESKPSTFSDMVKKIGFHCNKFHGLKIRGLITKEDVMTIVESLPNLKWLDLSYCRFGREELLAIVKGCRSLKRLSVSDCVGFEVDEEVKRRASGIEIFEHEGCMIEDACEFEVEDDRDFNMQEMLMYYDDCYAMWLF